MINSCGGVTHVGPPPTGGAVEVEYIVDQVAVKGRGLGDPILGY